VDVRLRARVMEAFKRHLALIDHELEMLDRVLSRAGSGPDLPADDREERSASRERLGDASEPDPDAA
jgi:hypothetical protein